MAIVERKNVSTQIIDYILDLIIQGKLKKGDRIMNEREFSEILGASRVPLREAISALSLVGVLTPKQGEGTFVSTYNPDIFSRVIYANVVLEDTSIDDIMRVRCIVESNSAELAAAVATEEDLRAIDAAKNEHAEAVKGFQKGASSFERVIEKDHSFHNAIVVATHNSFFKQFFDVLRHSIKYCHMSCINQPETFTGFVDMHQKIFDAIKDKQTKRAYIYMHDHVADYESGDTAGAKEMIAKDFYEYKSRLEDSK
jgi:GntR family transcriptional repressor for pyruvate dehydrogenase complex